MKPATLLAALFLLSAIPATRAELSREDWKRAEDDLGRALASKDVSGMGASANAVARDDSPRAVKTLLTALEAGRDLGVYDPIRKALSSMRGEEAREEVAKQAKSHRQWSIRYACVEAAGRVGDETGRRVVFERFEDREREVALLAYRLAGELKWVDAVDPLIDTLAKYEKTKDEDRIAETHGALSAITDREFPTAELWKAWWDKNREGFQPGRSSEPEGLLSRVKRRRFGDYRSITEIGEGEIVVVKGIYDEVERVLAHLEIPHRVIEREAFANEPLDPKQVLIFNCHDTAFEFSSSDIGRIGQFVAGGGYLFTSDWDLQNVSSRVFPKHLGVGSPPTDEYKVKIRPGPAATNHPLMKDVFSLNPYEHALMNWQIDGVSFPVDVRDRSVEVLVVSDELAEKVNSDVVAVTFLVRGNAYAPPGRVLHVLSHFAKQLDEKDDKYALQQLLLNFLVEKKQNWAKAKKER